MFLSKLTISAISLVAPSFVKRIYTYEFLRPRAFQYLIQNPDHQFGDNQMETPIPEEHEINHRKIRGGYDVAPWGFVFSCYCSGFSRKYVLVQDQVLTHRSFESTCATRSNRWPSNPRTTRFSLRFKFVQVIYSGVPIPVPLAMILSPQQAERDYWRIPRSVFSLFALV